MAAWKPLSASRVASVGISWRNALVSWLSGVRTSTRTSPARSVTRTATPPAPEPICNWISRFTGGVAGAADALCSTGGRGGAGESSEVA